MVKIFSFNIFFKAEAMLWFFTTSSFKHSSNFSTSVLINKFLEILSLLRATIKSSKIAESNPCKSYFWKYDELDTKNSIPFSIKGLEFDLRK